MQQTKHAQVRAQLRAIPPMVDRLLDEFGEELHDGHGCVKYFFSHQSIRKMERALGRHPTKLLKPYMHAYRVERSDDGTVITRGWRTSRLNRV